MAKYLMVRLLLHCTSTLEWGRKVLSAKYVVDADVLLEVRWAALLSEEGGRVSGMGYFASAP